MADTGSRHAATGVPDLAALLELLKPITWFAPMWAFGCGVVSAGRPIADVWHVILAGAVLAGPLVCGTSQAVNDWFDRHVDAINEPGRPIPSGRVPGQLGIYVAIAGSVIALLYAAWLGPLILGAAVVGVALAWAYSAPPLRLKEDGWWGNSAVAGCYEGLPWFTGAALAAGAMPSNEALALALLYSIGAHGIMTLNDFKAIEGDRRMGVASLPVQLGPDRAARLACLIMAVPQVIVIALLIGLGCYWYGAIVAVLLAAQIALMPRLLRDPKGQAPFYNATGTTFYVLGMLASAFAVGGLQRLAA